jgi:hypothetical protein
VIRLQAGKAEEPCLNFWEEQEISVFSEVSTLALRPTQPSIQCIVGAFPWVKVVGCETGSSPPSSLSYSFTLPLLLFCGWTVEWVIE